MFEAIFLLISSIGIMLLGVKMLSENLQKLTGSKVREKVSKFTSNPIKATFSGALLTFIMQSSTASTIMTVGLTSIGLFSLIQGLSFTIGCNLGSSFTTIMLLFNGLSVKEVFAAVCFVGVLITFFKNENLKCLGRCLTGFGLLFAGLSFISSNISIINNYVNIANIFTLVSNPILLFFIGIVVTIFLQTSFGSLALLISIVSTGALSNIGTIYSLSFLIYGFNVGTTLTTFVVSLSSNADGKRVALYHIFYNIFGVTLFMLLNLFGFANIFEYVTNNLTLQIILLNLTFNIVNASLMLALVKPISVLLKKMFKFNKKEDIEKWKLDDAILQSPSMAVKHLNFMINELFLEVSKFYNKTLEYTCNEVANCKLLNQQHSKLCSICEQIYTNTYKINQCNEMESAFLLFVRFFTNIVNKILNSCKEISKTMIIDKEKIILFQKQKKVINDIEENQLKVFDQISIVLDMLYSGNKEYDYKNATLTIMEYMSINSEIKNSQKLEYVENYSTKTEKKHYVFFVLLNKLTNMTNYMSDLAVEALEFASKFLKDNSKGDSNEKDANPIKSVQ